MSQPSVPALPVESQQVMSPSAQEVATAMAAAGASLYGATGCGSTAGTSFANGMAAGSGFFANIDAASMATQTVAPEANDLVVSADGGGGAIFPDMVMPRRHQEMADGERLRLDPAPLLSQGAPQQSSDMAVPLRPTHAAATPDASIVHLQGIQHVTTGHVHATGSSSQPPVFRWVSRLTEFLRTTAARGASSVDRVMEDIGFSPMIPSTMSPAQQRPGSAMSQQALMSGQGVQQRVMKISPPEELAAGLAIPATWSQATGMSTSLEPLRLRTPGRSALFEQGELDQLQRMQARSSLLLGASAQPAQQSDGNSTSSSANLQAEVQRQLEEYGQRQKLEMQRLQQEIFNLRAERDALQEGKRLSGMDASTIRPQSGVASSQPEGRAADLPGHPQVSAPQSAPSGQVAKAAGVPGLWGLAGVPAGQPPSSPLPRLATLFEGQGISGGNGRTADLPGHPQVSAPSQPHAKTFELELQQD